MATVTETKAKSNNEPLNPRHKYQNQTQLLQGVAAVCEPRLSLSERLCLFTLGAFTVRPSSEVYAHPGNAILMHACGIATRQGMNAVIKRLRNRKLIEPMGHEKGGRGLATVYRICVEDSRFPWPKVKHKPATDALQDTEAKTRNATVAGNADAKPATDESKTRNGQTINPQRTPDKPATLELHPDSSTSDSNERIQAADKGQSELPAAASSIIQNGIEKLRQGLEWSLYYTIIETKPGETVRLERDYELFKQKANCLGLGFKTLTGLYNAALKSVTTRVEQERNAKAQPAPTPAVNPEDDPIPVDRYQVANFREHAKRFRWSKEQLKTFLQNNFGVESEKELHMGNFTVALKALHDGPPMPRASLPAWIPVLQWDEYLDVRRKYKKPFAEEDLIQKLAQLRDSGNDPAVVLQQSIDHKWSALYPVLAAHQGLKM